MFHLSSILQLSHNFSPASLSPARQFRVVKFLKLWDCPMWKTLGCLLQSRVISENFLCSLTLRCGSIIILHAYFKKFPNGAIDTSSQCDIFVCLVCIARCVPWGFVLEGLMRLQIPDTLQIAEKEREISRPFVCWFPGWWEGGKEGGWLKTNYFKKKMK